MIHEKPCRFIAVHTPAGLPDTVVKRAFLHQEIIQIWLVRFQRNKVQSTGIAQKIALIFVDPEAETGAVRPGVGGSLEAHFHLKEAKIHMRRNREHGIAGGMEQRGIGFSGERLQAVRAIGFGDKRQHAIGHCILGYAAQESKAAVPRKENYIYRI